MLFFITHTVQMELVLTQKKAMKLMMLYNPHGSDGTFLIVKSLLVFIYFITHTVQMEPNFPYQELLTRTTL